MDLDTMEAPSQKDAMEEFERLANERQALSANIASLQRQLEQNAVRATFLQGVVVTHRHYAAPAEDHPALRVIEGEGGDE